MQVVTLHEQERRIAELEEALQREQDRARMLEREVLRLRARVQSAPTSPSNGASSDGGAGGASGATAAANSTFSTSSIDVGPGTAEQPGVVHERGDMVQISRQALELLHLKERAMEAVKEGITIADCSSPDMPLVYVNDGFSRITGYTVEDTLNKNCR